MKNLLVPEHVAFIMDGNRRWAKNKGLPAFVGHKQGAEALNKVINHAGDRGVKMITAFAFSTDNKNRPADEIDYLMDLLIKWLNSHLPKMKEKKVRFKVIGNRVGLRKNVLEAIEKAEDETSANNLLALNFAFNYGGRDEIVRAVQKIIKQNISENEITEEVIGDNLDLAGLPDPDMIIRTSGEQRLSGFLPWNSVYSELYFSKVYWPDFDEKEFDLAIEEFGKRQRRFGR